MLLQTPHHGTKTDFQTHIKPVYENVKEFKSDKCSFVAETSISLKRHDTSIYLNIPNFKCKNCSLAFDQKSEVKDHIGGISWNTGPVDHMSRTYDWEIY